MRRLLRQIRRAVVWLRGWVVGNGYDDDGDEDDAMFFGSHRGRQ